MAPLRNILFQIHLWTGLTVGVFFIVLGLSGSAIVYPQLLAPSTPPVPLATAEGSPMALEDVLEAARSNTPQTAGRAAILTLPRNSGEAIAVQFNAPRGGAGPIGGRGEGGRRGIDGGRGEGRNPDAGRAAGRGGPEAGRGAPPVTTFVDPVSGKILGTRTQGPGGLSGLARQLHEALLLGAFGRSFVAWLGVAMLFLGFSGLYLWWPKGGQWKYAFIVRRNARGARLYREIHGMFGIWFWLVFIVVVATSIPLGFQSVMALVSGQQGGPPGPPPGSGASQAIEAPAGAIRLPLATLVANAQKAVNAKALSVTVPAQPDRAVTVNLENGGDRPRSMALNPYTGEALASPANASQQGISRADIEQFHGGLNQGPVWQFLVFLSGFLPLLFVTTGLMMWLKKRQARPSVPRAS